MSEIAPSLAPSAPRKRRTRRILALALLVIACPHTDLIKVWPLPVQQPWYEDPFYQPVTAMRVSY